MVKSDNELFKVLKSGNVSALFSTTYWGEIPFPFIFSTYFHNLILNSKRKNSGAPRPHPYTHHKCKFVEAVFMECSCPPIIFTVIKHLYHGRVQGLPLVKVTYFHLKGYNTFVPHIQTLGDILGMVQELPAFCPKSIIDYRKRRKCCTASPKAKGGRFLQTFRYLRCEYGGE